jgi:hypothetical protein
LYAHCLSCSSFEFDSCVTDESKLNLCFYGGVPDLSVRLQCDVGSLGIWFWGREICGHSLEDEAVL